MKQNKLVLLSISILFLVLVFFFTTEKKEDQQELELWKLNPSSIKFFPPKDSSALASKFSTDEFHLEKKEIGLKSSPIFWLNGKDKNGKTYSYEGNYNIKNLFSELSILRTKGLNEAKPEYLEKFNLKKDDSPKLEIYVSNKLSKEILIGNESENSYRYVFADNSIFLVQNFIFQKFTNSKFELREKNYFRSGEFEIQRVILSKDQEKITIENQAYSKDGVQSSKWFKISSGKIRLEPSIASTMYSNLQNLKANLFPDEENGEGFEVAEELVKNPFDFILEVQFLNGTSSRIKVFPKVILKDKNYFPVIKEVDSWKESVSYTDEDSIKRLIDSIDRIKTAVDWQEPKAR